MSAGPSSDAARLVLPSVMPAHDLRARYDTVVVGGGHNGLVAAGYLVGAGRSVAVRRQGAPGA